MRFTQYSGYISSVTGLFVYFRVVLYIRCEPICMILHLDIVIYSYITWIIVNYKTWTKVI